MSERSPAGALLAELLELCGNDYGERGVEAAEKRLREALTAAAGEPEERCRCAMCRAIWWPQ